MLARPNALFSSSNSTCGGIFMQLECKYDASSAKWQRSNILARTDHAGDAVLWALGRRLRPNGNLSAPAGYELRPRFGELRSGIGQRNVLWCLLAFGAALRAGRFGHPFVT
jgi:hypothetical protein